MMMTSEQFRDSLREFNPRVFVDGERVDSIADDRRLEPGINAIGVTYDYPLVPDHAAFALATQHTSGRELNRFLHINRSADDLLKKMEYVRAVCRETGCAQRYLVMDAFNALFQTTFRMDQENGGASHERFIEYMHRVQDADLTLAIAMTDAKGDRSLRPHQQPVRDSHVHVVRRRPDGIVISGTKAIVTSAPYVHELLVLPGRAMDEDDRDFAVACAVPLDARGLTIAARPAGRPGESKAVYSNRYGQSTGVCMFKDVFVPWDRVFLCGEWQHSEMLTKTYANHHRHTCIAARAGFGDLLIGAGALMIEANGLCTNRHGHLRDTMVELIKVVEGFYACGVAASTFAVADPAGNVEPDPVYSNIGKLLMANQIYDMHRLAHTVSGGLIVTLPNPEEDHNPETAADLARVLGGRQDIPYEKRIGVARLLEDLTASYYGSWMSTISLHGGGSPEAMKREIHRHYPVEDRKKVVEDLMERGIYNPFGRPVSDAPQPGQCCDTGCKPDQATGTGNQGSGE